MNDATKQIEETILDTVTNAQAIFRDPMNDGAHFEATVIGESFVCMPLAKQHRLVRRRRVGLLDPRRRIHTCNSACP
jgi:acid stress-induced BolA-like protein IbaG/YrbA